MSFKVIGLISGGKDSLYSLAHCIQQGHQIVALANLHPRSTRVENHTEDQEFPDLNSFMYQTVGHSLIHLYAEALGLPLYRREITGSAVQTSQYYSHGSSSPSGNDEVDDMWELIRSVRERHPEANGLSAGAILSTYQRTRVESIAISLGLVPVAYLWQYPSLPSPLTRTDSLTGLLDDMAHAGCDARIIKLASGGISSDLLWSNVTSTRAKTKMLKGLQRFHTGARQESEFRAAILGEGGEYETLAIDGPRMLWKGRLEVEVGEEFDIEGVKYVKLQRGKVVEKTSSDACSANTIPVPELWDQRFHAIKQSLTARTDINPTSITTDPPMTSSPSRPTIPSLQFSHSLSSSTLQIHNLNFSSLPAPSDTPSPPTAPSQFQALLASLPHILSSINAQSHLPDHLDLSARKVVHVTLLLNSMSDFPAINALYTAHLWPSTLANPPARVTVSAPLPDNALVAMSVVLDLAQDRGGQERKGLHVQSRSYWAPANIGPYSQAIATGLFAASLLPPSTSAAALREADARGTASREISAVGELVYMAGQIPLVPATMAMCRATFAEQASLALQHLWRVGQERSVDLWSAGVAYLSKGVALKNVQTAAMIWQLAHEVGERGQTRQSFARMVAEDDDGGTQDEDDEEEAEEIDVWHHQHNRGFGGGSMTVGEHLHPLPDGGVLPVTPGFVPPFIAAEVESLPREAPIEWWSTGLARLSDCDADVQVSAISTSSDDISISGLVVQCVNDSEDPSEYHQNCLEHRSNKVMLFLTMTSPRNFTSGFNEEVLRRICAIALQDLKDGFEIGDQSVVRLVSGYSFVNLAVHQSCDGREDKLGIGLTTVPCYHVWASAVRNSSQYDDMKGQQVEEIALATVTQIEIELK